MTETGQREKLIRVFNVFVLLALIILAFLYLPLDYFGGSVLGELYISAFNLIGLLAMAAAILLAAVSYRDREFLIVAFSFFLFGILFLIAELLLLLTDGRGEAMFYILNALWLVGIIPPIVACWRTVFKFSEYMDVKTFIAIVLLVFSAAVLMLVLVGAAVTTSSFYPGIENKVLAVAYLYLDTMLLLGLISLLHIYSKGRLETYWEFITVGALLFSLADIGNAASRAYEADVLVTLFDGFYAAAYASLAYGFALVAFSKLTANVMSPGRMYRIKEIFLIHSSGVLLAHVSTGAREARADGEVVDDMILGSMLTAVQAFIKDSFQRGTDATSGELKRLQWGDGEIHIENGKNVFLAVVLEGKGTEHLHEKMHVTLRAVEARYGPHLDNWDGDEERFAGADGVVKEGLL